MSVKDDQPTQSTPRRLHISIGTGPECPACHEWRFDDWHHAKSLRSHGGSVGEIGGSLKCHGCGRFFSVTKYHDGVFHSTMWRKVA